MPETILSIFRRNALHHGIRPCFHYKEGGGWKNLSWIDAEERVRRYSLGLGGLGLKADGRVALLSDTRMEWTLLDLAILASRAVTVPIYSTLAPDQVAYILKDADVSILIIENVLQWERIFPSLSNFNKPVILIDGEKENCIRLETLVEKGKSLPVNLYDENLKELSPSDMASIVYTSGTTGIPKGASLTHRNILAEIEGLQEIFRFNGELIGMMCLPLAHVVARAMQFHQLAQGCQAAYAESLAQLPANLKEIRPHYMAGVPRLFEKSHEAIKGRIRRSSRRLQNLFEWSLKIGTQVSELKQRKMGIPISLRLAYAAANLLVFRKIRKGFGGRIRYFVCGGAPLNKHIAQFFHAAGMLIVEGYGLTETFAAVTLNRIDDFRFGTVGKPLEGVRVKINEEGEICVKGENVFGGYLGKKEESARSFDDEGWLLTGDIGEFTKDGFLRITDRKKDIIITSGGKNVAPQSIENLLQQSPYIQQVLVHGDGRKFLSALVTLNWETIEAFAKEQQIPFDSRKDLSQNEKILKLVEKEIETGNQRLSSFETIKKFAVIDSDFSIESGELTPTMKIKRKWVIDKYKNLLDSFYREG